MGTGAKWFVSVAGEMEVAVTSDDSEGLFIHKRDTGERRNSASVRFPSQQTAEALLLGCLRANVIASKSINVTPCEVSLDP